MTKCGSLEVGEAEAAPNLGVGEQTPPFTFKMPQSDKAAFL